MRLDGVVLGVLVAFAFVAQFVIDRRLVARAFAVGIPPRIFNGVRRIREVADFFLDNLVVVPGRKLVELRRPERPRHRVDAQRRRVGQILSDNAAEARNLFFGIIRVLYIEFVAQAYPDIGKAPISGGDILEIGCGVGAVVAGPQDGSRLLSVRPAQNQVRNQVMLPCGSHSQVGPPAKPSRIGPMRIVAAIGQTSFRVKEGLFVRVRIAVAVQAEAKLLEIFRVARDVGGDVVAARFVVRIVAREERIMRVAEDVLMRAVRAHVPSPARAVRIGHPETRMV